MTLAAMVLQLFAVPVVSAAVYGAGDVVINEIAWAGSTDSSGDEWIELYNTTNQSIDLSGWSIVDDGSTSYTVQSGQISPYGYFLILDNEDAVSVGGDALIGLSLANAGDSLVLKDATGAVIDTVNGSGGSWYAGDLNSKASMERIDPNSGVDSAANWADAVLGNGAVSSLGSVILGTPDSANSVFNGSGPSVKFGYSQGAVSVGDTLSMSVDIADISDLYAYGFEIAYDPAVLSFVSASEAGFLGSDGQDTVFNAALENGSEGKLIAGAARLANPPSGVDGGGTLFNMSFDVIGGDGQDTVISFAGTSFATDVNADIAVNFKSASLSVGAAGQVAGASNLQIASGSARYSLSLTWDAPVNGADKYIVQRQNIDGVFVNLGEATTTNFVDDDNVVNGGNLIPGVSYIYRIIAVKGGINSAALEGSGSENRGFAGDIDRSDRVDGRDIEQLARAYGSVFGDEEYKALADSNYDGIIDGSDLINIGVNFGLKY